MRESLARYVLTVDFLEGGMEEVRVEHESGIVFEEAGWDFERGLERAQGAIIEHWNARVAADG